jgi:hypothetical protein
MTTVARRRLGRQAARVEIASGSFVDAALPRADAVVATYSLHHIKRRADKQQFYRRIHRALRRGGVLVSGDCFPSKARGQAATWKCG